MKSLVQGNAGVAMCFLIALCCFLVFLIGGSAVLVLFFWGRFLSDREANVDLHGEAHAQDAPVSKAPKFQKRPNSEGAQILTAPKF